jgi:hypothetical protein
VKGPFFEPDVRQGTLSIVVPSPLLGVVPAVVPFGDFPSRGAGLGKIGRNFVVVVLVDDVEAGDDLDEVFDRGEGPETSGEGVSVGMLGEIHKRVVVTLL